MLVQQRKITVQFVFILDIYLSWFQQLFINSAELTRLWSICPDNKAACQADDRMYLPTLKDFFQDAYDQEDPVNQIEDQYKYEKICITLVFLVHNFFGFLFGCYYVLND